MLHSTPSTTPFSSLDYKLASTYLDSPLHGCTPILRGAHLQLLGAPRAFRKDLSLVLCFFPLFISPIAHIVTSYGLLQQPYADDTQLYVAISKDNYDTPVTKLQLCLSTIHTWFCYNGPGQIRGNRVWHYPALMFSSNYLYCQCRRNPCPGFQSGHDSWRYPRQ